MAINFIARAACRGTRPAQFSANNDYRRPALIARLLKERNVARFIVAPCGYGKSSLAMEYAETVFDWEHTFWISGTSPCFLRDLDAEVIESACRAADEHVALVVIDNLPRLDDERTEQLSRQIDSFLDGGIEVMITCRPSNDMPGRFQQDRLCLDGRALLLDDEELELQRSPNERRDIPVGEVPESQRIPALVWGRDTSGAYQFARNILSEELPNDILLTMVSILILQSGSLTLLNSLVSTDEDLIENLRLDYPHLGIYEELDGFEASHLEMEDLAAALKGRLGALADRSSKEDKGELVAAWAAALLSGGKSWRACEVMRFLGSRQSRCAWLRDNIRAIIAGNCFFQTYLIVRDHKGLTAPVRSFAAAVEALCLVILGQPVEAAREAQSILQGHNQVETARLLSAFVLWRVGADEAAAAGCAYLRDRAQEESSIALSEASDETLLVRLWFAAQRGLDVLLRLWELYASNDVPREVLCLGACWAFRLMGDSEEGGIEAGERQAFPEAMEGFVRRSVLEQPCDSMDFFVASAGLSMEEAHGRGIRYQGDALEAPIVFSLHQVEMAVMAQRGWFNKLQRADQAKRNHWLDGHDSYLTQAIPAGLEVGRRIPTLSLKLFGCFQVVIGDTPIDTKHFKRQNARALLVLLAANLGREVPRDQLTQAMWPQSDPVIARKNFYTVWAELRHALELSDGSCPYLVRHQFGCSLNQRYVRSDVARLAEICRELLFSNSTMAEWESLYEEIDRDFSGDLMPFEYKNPLIIAARNEYRTRLVDALVAATANLAGSGHPEWSIWYARLALAHDETREDAWLALMRAQVASNQRTAAMMTYLKCRKVLDEQLGIDPSPETASVYQSLLTN